MLAEVILNDPGLARIIEKELIQPYEQLILDNWLDGGKGRDSVSMEYGIKRYLDRLGTMLLKGPGDHGILTERMQRRLAARELPLSPQASAADIIKTNRSYRKRGHGPLRSRKLAALCKENPGAEIHWLRVDTEGCFRMGPIAYRVSHSAYAPVQLAADAFYPMDQVGAVLSGDGKNVRYYTQALDLIAPNEVAALPNQGEKENTNDL